MAPRKIVLAVDSLACDAITTEPEIPIVGNIVGNNDRDEVYFMVSGDSSRGLVARRLPTQDDYYEFTAGQVAHGSDFRTWTNQGQLPIGRPILWTGELDDGEGLNVLVVIAEQDNRKLGEIKRALRESRDFLQKQFGGQNKTVDFFLEAAKPLIEVMPEVDQHDVIGAFGIYLHNQAGNIILTWVPWLQYEFESGKSGATTVENTASYFVNSLKDQGISAVNFDFRATEQGRYRGVITAKVVEQFSNEPLELLGDTVDRCDADILYVNDRVRGLVPIREGQSNIQIDVPNHRFYWYCGDDQRVDDDKDWTTAPVGTDRVLVTRGAARKITWLCYRDPSRYLPEVVAMGLKIDSDSPQPEPITKHEVSQHLFARDEKGHLIHYYWFSQGGWKAENLTQYPNIGENFLLDSPPIALNLAREMAPTVQHVFARNSNGDLIHYYWWAEAGWQAENLTSYSNIGNNYQIAGVPVAINLKRDNAPMTQHVFARNVAGDLIHYYWWAEVGWHAENLTEYPNIGEAYRIDGDPSVSNLQQIDAPLLQHVFAHNAEGELIIYYWWAESGWNAANLTKFPNIGAAYRLLEEVAVINLERT